jgi:hypothetical protein
MAMSLEVVSVDSASVVVASVGSTVVSMVGSVSIAEVVSVGIVSLEVAVAKGSSSDVSDDVAVGSSSLGESLGDAESSWPCWASFVSDSSSFGVPSSGAEVLSTKRKSKKEKEERGNGGVGYSFYFYLSRRLKKHKVSWVSN